MKSKILQIISIILLFSTIAFAGSIPRLYLIISPGVKIGYTLGDNGGFTYGFELSVIPPIHNSYINYGGVISVDYTKKYLKFHLGIEGFAHVAGIDVGPTFLRNYSDNKTYYGFSITPFAGLLVYPYFSYTKIYNYNYNKPIYELGTYGKFPIIKNDGTSKWWTFFSGL